MKKIGVLIDYENQATYNDLDEDDATYEDIFIAITHLAALIQGRGEDVVELLYAVLDTLGSAEIVEEPPRYLN